MLKIVSLLVNVTNLLGSKQNIAIKLADVPLPDVRCLSFLGYMSSDVEEPERKPRGISTEDCQRMVDRAITRDPVVKFLLEKLDEVNTLPPVPFRL